MSDLHPRREFLVGSCAATGLAAAADSNFRRKLRLAFAGVGNRGETNLLRFRNEQIVALCDVDQRFLRRAQQVVPQARSYADFRQLLQQERDLDGVVISTPDHTHAVFAVAAMRRGLHVYCEKPLAHNLRELRVLRTAAKRHQVVAQTGVQHHSAAGYQQVMQWLSRGLVGEIESVHAWTNRPIWQQGDPYPPSPGDRLPTGFNYDLWLGPAHRQPFHTEMHPLGWRGWWDFGGGAVADMAPHLLDPLVTGLDLHVPHHIQAKTSPLPPQGPPAWSEIRFQCYYPGAERSSRVTPRVLNLFWYDGTRRPPAKITGIQRLPANGVMVIGSLGRLFYPDLGRKPTLLPPIGKQAKPKTPPPPTALTTNHHDNWLAAMRGTETIRCDFSYGARLCSFGCLGNIAIRAGVPIEWDEEHQRVINHSAANQFVRRSYRRTWQM